MQQERLCRENVCGPYAFAQWLQWVYLGMILCYSDQAFVVDDVCLRTMTLTWCERFFPAASGFVDAVWMYLHLKNTMYKSSCVSCFCAV